MRGLFLDLDGTLAVSLDVMKQVYFGFLFTHGSAGSDAEFERLNGIPMRLVIRRMKDTHKLAPTHEQLELDFFNHVEKVYQTVQVSPGARTVIDLVKKHEWKVAEVTSNSEKIASDWLKRVGLGPAIDCLITQQSVTKGKPHPEPYLKALEKTGCDPTRSIAVEDSYTGVESATAAGLKTFALGSSHSVNHEKLAGHISQFSELVELINVKS